METKGSWLGWLIISTAVYLFLNCTPCAAQEPKALGVGDWLTFAANIPEAGYRRTDFFYRQYNTGILLILA